MKPLQKLICLSFLLAFLAFKADTNIDLQTKAKSEHKNIVVYFCGSDWCSICTKFKKSFLVKTEVETLLQSQYVYYVADFPQRTKLEPNLEKYNEFLADKLNPEGEFPLLVIADENLVVKEKIHATLSEDLAFQKLKNNGK
ncbi:thioredoxin-like protein [Arcicella aurantiaca]|uniref:Thioredoxin-like protein n=1 Tax=Arcicella aurantiaca TaxID=591202 RepID=A0A316DQ14_9BACT|nr:thioredoxin family protein [Arcicella aurantiaca]PWK20065.1 thioredoxin-like protein [Arcicella aurantiaca]